MSTSSLRRSEVAVADWTEFRRQMPVAEHWAYFDHAAVSPLSGPSRSALIEWADQAARIGDSAWLGWSGQAEDLRMLLAQMIGAQTDEIALIRSTTEAIGLVAEGFRWQPGDNVVIPADEFPSNQYPWLNLAERGVETRRVPTDADRVDLDRLADACDHRTRIVSLSWVGFASGWRNDLDQVARLTHQRGALLFVDAIQGLGVFPLDVGQTPIDFLAADGHKWLLGPEGAGVFFIRREHLDRLRAIGVGWSSVVGSQDFTRIDLVLKNSAARFEGGSNNLAGLIALKASIELLARFGAKAISQRVIEITDLACQRLASIGAIIKTDRQPGHQSGIVSFELPGRDPVAVGRHCRARKVALSCRAGRLRISPHAYNDASDVDRLVEVLQEPLDPGGV